MEIKKYGRRVFLSTIVMLLILTMIAVLVTGYYNRYSNAVVIMLLFLSWLLFREAYRIERTNKDIMYIKEHGVRTARHLGKTLLINDDYKTEIVKHIYKAPEGMEFLDACRCILYLTEDKYLQEDKKNGIEHT